MEDNYPKDGPDIMYRSAGYAGISMKDLWDEIRDKWGPEISMEDLTFTAEHIHVRCLNYDLYDSGDYQDYICITRRTGT